MLIQISSPGLRVLVPPSSLDERHHIQLGDDDLACGPAGPTGPWRMVAAAGGRQINDREFVKPLSVNWKRFSVQVIRGVLETGAQVHFDLTNMRALPALLEGTGQYAQTITSHELRWLQAHWARWSDAVVFWDDVIFRDDRAYGRQVKAPWDWSTEETAAHTARLGETAVDEELVRAA